MKSRSGIQEEMPMKKFQIFKKQCQVFTMWLRDVGSSTLPVPLIDKTVSGKTISNDAERVQGSSGACLQLWQQYAGMLVS